MRLGTFSDFLVSLGICTFVTLFVCCFLGVFGSIGFILGFIVVGLITVFTLIEMVS